MALKAASAMGKGPAMQNLLFEKNFVRAIFGAIFSIFFILPEIVLAGDGDPTCDDVPRGKIIQGTYGVRNAYYAGGYIGDSPINTEAPPPGTIPANYRHFFTLACLYPRDRWPVGIYVLPFLPEASKGNTSKFPGTQMPINQIDERSCEVGNPCFVGTGTKKLKEIDFIGTGFSALSLTRTYRSSYLAPPNDGFGVLWMHEWQRRVDLSHYHNATAMGLNVLRADGATTAFSLAGGVWTALDGSQDVISILADGGGVTQGFTLLDRRNDRVDEYDKNGRLIKVRERNGWIISLIYSDSGTPATIAPADNLLIEIRNNFGKTIKFTYTARNQISSAILPDGLVIDYAYNSGGLLDTVTYSSTVQRKYHYENNQFRWALTGITDEKGVRFATYGYDSLGRVTSTEHAGGVDKFQLSFQGNGQTSVTTADGTSRTFTSELQGNVLRASGASAPCPACGDIAKAVTYDAAGNVASRKDFADKETRYSYDALGRETQRIEGYGTADTKTTTTEWHPTWNFPIKAAAPGRIDTFEYDANGRVTSYAWYPTSDNNGSQGTSGAPAGSIAKSIWTYNEQGLLASTVESVDANVTGQWAFTYDPLGNLASVTTPEGKTGQALRYDSAGRVLEAMDADGNHQQYEYNSRGQIVRYDVAGKTVTYEYNALGFLTAVRGPEGSYIGYEYDDAHHLRAFLLQPEVTETVSTISPFTTAQTTADSGNAKSAGIWQRMWSWIKSWLGELVGNAHAQSSVQRIPVPPVLPMGAPGCNGTGCQQTLLDCLANCIRAYDPLSDEFKVALTGLGGTFPKAMVGLPRGLGGASRMTTVPSALAHGLGGGGAGTAGGAARVVGRVASPIWIGYGLYLAGMEGYCAADCAMNACSH